MRIALAQLNTVVGDLDGNRDRILELRAASRGRGRRPRRLPRARGHGLPARGPAPPPRLREGGGTDARGDRRRDCRARWPSSACRSSTAISPTHAPSARRGAWSASTASSSSPTTGSSTSTATSPQDVTCCCSASATCSSGPRSARTCGSPGRRPPTSRLRARSCSSTCPRRRSTSARPRIARRCSSPARGTTLPTSRSATWSAARTS